MAIELQPRTADTLERLKRLAKFVKKEQGLQHFKALDIAAQRYGFANYTIALRQIERRPPQ